MSNYNNRNSYQSDRTDWGSVLRWVGGFAIVIGIAIFAYNNFLRVSPQSVKRAEVTDFWTNTEEKQNGTMIMFVQTDTTSGYCETDKAAFEWMRLFREYHVMMTAVYKTINAGDGDGATVLGQGCDAERGGITMYRMLSFKISEWPGNYAALEMMTEAGIVIPPQYLPKWWPHTPQ